MGRTLRASAVTFSAREMTVNWPGYMAILLTKGPWLGLDSTDVYIYKGALLSVELSRRHSQMVFFSSTEGLNTLPWHWVKLTRSSNILPEGIFLTLFSSIPSSDSSLWLHGWALLPLPCYGARWSTNMLRSHARLGKAGCAIPLRKHPVDHKWYHIEVLVGVPSVSTQCLGLLRVLEPSRCGTPLRVSPC